MDTWRIVRAQLDRVLTQPGSSSDVVRSRAMWTASYLARVQGDYGEVERWAKLSAACCQAVGDLAGEGSALLRLGIGLGGQGKLTEANWSCRESLGIFERVGDIGTSAICLNVLGQLAMLSEDYSAAREQFECALERNSASPDIGEELVMRTNLANASFQLGLGKRRGTASIRSWPSRFRKEIDSNDCFRSPAVGFS